MTTNIGPVETLVLEAWGVGVRIDTDTPAQQAKLVDLLDRARALDGADVDEFTVPNLVAFVQSLSRRLLQCAALHGPGNEKAAKDALAFIERKGLRGSILREAPPNGVKCAGDHANLRACAACDEPGCTGHIHGFCNGAPR